MPAKIKVTSHISLHTWSRRTKFFHFPDGRETKLATGHQDVNKNTYEANILCSLTFKVFQKHTFLSHKTFATNHRRNVPSPKRRHRTVLDRPYTYEYTSSKHNVSACFAITKFLTPGSHTIRSDGNLPYACSLFQFWRVIRSHFRATLSLNCRFLISLLYHVRSCRCCHLLNLANVQ